MTQTPKVAAHYTRGNLLAAITQGVTALGKTPSTVTIDDLAPVDEFHIGGRQASIALLDQLGFTPAHRVLDIGCGLGGTARLAADRYGCRVTGIDLTAEFIETGTQLCRWLRLGDRITLQQGNALSLPFPDDTFDGAYVIHVGMNIADKALLFSEIYRVLRPGGNLGVYDVMRIGAGELVYPVPWAADATTSSVATPQAYRDALHAAGFEIRAERNRRDYALEFFDRLRAAQTTGPPPLGLHLVMGETAATKYRNMIQNISAGLVAPVEIVAGK